jgi:hypothetical protein
MRSFAVDYYQKRFGENLSAAFIHLVREIGEIARNGKEQPESCKAEDNRGNCFTAIFSLAIQARYQSKYSVPICIQA